MNTGDRVFVVLMICGIFWFNVVSMRTIITCLESLIAGQTQIASFMLVPGSDQTGPIAILKKPEPMKDKETALPLKTKVKP